MSYAFLGRISKSYSDLSGMFLEWAEQCSSLWVYEHEADESVNRTHCHILALDSKRDADGLKKLVSWKASQIEKGNTGSSFKTYKPELGYQCLTYYSKGVLKPMLCSGLQASDIAEDHRTKWVQHPSPQAQVKQKNKKTKKSHYDICEEIRNELHYVEKLTAQGIWEYRIKDFDEVRRLLYKKLDEYRIRTSEYDMDRWVFTIIRNDPTYGASAWERIKTKYAPERNLCY